MFIKYIMNQILPAKLEIFILCQNFIKNIRMKSLNTKDAFFKNPIFVDN
jgi:hypothetical protein